MTPEVCPNCGAEVPRNARACPGCGSDESTGWSENARVGGLNLPDEEFDYDEFARREFGGRAPRPNGLKPFWWGAAILLTLAMLYVFAGWLFH